MNNDIVSRIKEFMDYKSMNSLTLANKLGYKVLKSCLGFLGGATLNLLMISYTIFQICLISILTGL